MSHLELTLLHTNDMHGRLEAMARLTSLARRTREAAQAEGRLVFFWDAGDALDRRYRECSLSKGAALGRVLNAMGYSLMTMGNDILLTHGPQAMAELARRLDFPVLAANCRDGWGPMPPGLKETSLVSLPGGLSLGVVGLTAPWGGLYEAFGYRFPDTNEAASRLVRRLRSQGARTIVVLSHLGLEDDRRLAEAVGGVDLIIGAHSHDVLPAGLTHSGVWIAQAGAFAEHLGRIDLSLDRRSGRPVSVSARVIPVPVNEEPDAAVLAAIAEARREAEALAAQPVGELQQALDIDHQDECGIGSLAADALRERMKADIALIVAGQFRRGLPSGVVTLGDMNEVSLSTANPQCTPLRGAQIVAALERGLDSALTETVSHGLRGTPIGRPQISGMQVEFDAGRPVGQRVVRVLVSGEPLSPERTYRVAHTDAETGREIGLLRPEPDQKTEADVPTVTREVLEDYIRRHSPVPAPKGGRWREATSRSVSVE
jgi:2',3'-cyclic-nucleotide 2'-phosphodiesterase (5'-nucleotidase family)